MDHKEAQSPKILVDTCPATGPFRYDKLYENFIFGNFAKEFSSTAWAQWRLANTWQTSTRKRQHDEGSFYDDWKLSFESSCCMLNPWFQSRANAGQTPLAQMVINNEAVTTAIFSHADVNSEFLLNELALVVLEFNYPRNDEDASSEHGLFTMGSDHSSVIKDIFTAPVDGMVICGKAPKAKAKAKAKAKGNSRLEGTCDDIFAHANAMMEGAVSNGDRDRTRSRRLTDLLIHFVYGPLSGLKKRMIQFGACRSVMRQLVRFLYTKMAFLESDGTGVTKFDKALQIAVARVVGTHQEALRLLFGSHDLAAKWCDQDLIFQTESTAQVSDASVVGTASGVAAPATTIAVSPDAPVADRLREQMVDHSWIFELVAFAKERMAEARRSSGNIFETVSVSKKKEKL